MTPRLGFAALSLCASACAHPSPLSGPVEPSPPAVESPSAAAEPPPVADVDDVADASAPADAGEKLESLLPLRFLGPEKSLADLCGKKCRVRRKLPPVAPFKQLALADGTDPLSSRNDKTVVTTHVVVEADDGWYGTVIYRAGKGVEDVEMVNPRGMGMPPFGHMNRPVTYSGSLGEVRALSDDATKQGAVAIALTRSDGIEVNVQVVCGAGREGHPACGELRVTPPARVRVSALSNGVVDFVWPDGKHERFIASWRDE